jgi:FkbM family methyltransferase
MLLTSTPLFRLFILTIVSFFTTTQAHTTIEAACNLMQNGYSLIEPHLETDDFGIYANEFPYIQEFPFSLYKLTAVPSQGNFYVNNIDDTIKNHLRKKLCWEPSNQALIRKYVKPGTIALDIGAHIGTHTVTMSKCVGKKGKVFAFEPSKIIHRELTYNLVANNCRNTYPIRAAIGKTKSTVDIITSHPHNEGGSYVINAQGGSNTAIQLPLDIFNLNNISFIKIDVENMEADVLDGAASTILRNKPVMLVEVQGNGERPVQLGENTHEMALISIEKIRNLGYSLTKLPNSVDYLAIPNN